MTLAHPLIDGIMTLYKGQIYPIYEMGTRRKSLLSISHSFKEVIIVKDNIMHNRNEFGVTTICLFDFLLGKVGLDD
jgi:hypothetical protein